MNSVRWLRQQFQPVTRVACLTLARHIRISAVLYAHFRRPQIMCQAEQQGRVLSAMQGVIRWTRLKIGKRIVPSSGKSALLHGKEMNLSIKEYPLPRRHLLERTRLMISRRNRLHRRLNRLKQVIGALLANTVLTPQPLRPHSRPRSWRHFKNLRPGIFVLSRSSHNLERAKSSRLTIQRPLWSA